MFSNQLLQHFDHLVTGAAQGVIILIESFGITSIVQEVVREVAKMDARDVSKESSSMRNYSQFLIEVAEKCPQVIMPSLSLLTTFLDQEVNKYIEFQNLKHFQKLSRTY